MYIDMSLVMAVVAVEVMAVLVASSSSWYFGLLHFRGAFTSIAVPFVPSGRVLTGCKIEPVTVQRGSHRVFKPRNKAKD
ncbi:unnamed protein product [Victoria cruziana]